MRIAGHGIGVDAPPGWEVRIFRRAAAFGSEEVAPPMLHAATFAMPEERGDFGSGAVELMRAEDVFISLLEYGPEAANTAMFPPGDLPRSLDPAVFATNQLQRWLPGQAGYQNFVTDGDRPFCLYAVIGHVLRRRELTDRANEFLGQVDLADAARASEPA